MIKGVLRNFAKVTGRQHPCQSLFFNKVAGRLATSFKKMALMFSYEFCELLRTPFLQNTSGRLLASP